MSAKILLVDDEPHVLSGYQRRLGDQFDLLTAPGGVEGLAAMAESGPFAVVVADMRMPVMNGIQFLQQVKQEAPDTVRVMLTGNADMQTAIDAVNSGSIFKFLTKPCPIELFTETLYDGIKQYQLVTAERELLEQTLNGSIKVLIEVLSLANPAAFGRAARAARLVGKMAEKLELPGAWQFKLAAMLSQLGCITLPPEVMDKVNAHLPLTPTEQSMFDAHPSVGYKLLVNIPRLQQIARMIERQQQAAVYPISPSVIVSQEDEVTIGAQMLTVALDFDQRLTYGMEAHDALADMRRRTGQYNPALLTALGQILPKNGIFDDGDSNRFIVAVNAMDLKTGMIIESDVWSKAGNLLVQKGQEVTLPVLMRLRNFAQGIGIEGPIMVRAAPTPHR
ncbi:MAG: response regulator [Anaerolineae bacterium]